MKTAQRLLALLLLAAFTVTPVRGVNDTYSEYREDERSWSIGNPLVQVSFQVDGDGHFRYLALEDRASGRLWHAAESDPSSPVNLTVDGIHLDEQTPYTVVSHSFTDIASPAPGTRFSILLRTDLAAGDIRFEADVYEGQPFIRYRTIYRNTSPTRTYVNQADMLSWKFDDDHETYRDFFVGQWKFARGADFETHETNVSRQFTPVEMYTGAYADHTAWRAIRDSQDNGIVAAWEFDGRALAHVQQRRGIGTLNLDAEIMDLNHRLNRGEFFRVPDAFIGVFHGDWDEAGYRTQRFAENVLAVKVPETEPFPYVMFDTWGYGQEIDETTAMEAAERASELGAEVFILDLGWAKQIGDWNPDPAKFPDGLLPLSDYVHRLGMKFGLHLPLLEAAADSPVLLEHPDWEAVDPDRRSYFGATSLCPSHRPARQWIIAETIRVIREYGVDWVTQDGENMVKICNSTTHSHAPGDSNYSNAEDGLDMIIRAVQAATPGVVWENCEDGGSMQTFKMVQHYVTSVINDSDDAFTTRRAVYGATYPFPARYTERYMMDEPDDTYHTRSYMFGGPFILMNRITRWSSGTTDFVKREVALYKSIRESVRDAQIFHITRPDGYANDAIEAHDPAQDRAVLFVYSDENRSNVTFVQPKGLDPDAVYWVGFLEVPHSYMATGWQLMSKSIPVILPPWTGEIVSIIRR